MNYSRFHHRLRYIARRAIHSALKTFGEDWDKISLEGSLSRIKRRKTPINTVIDVGASDGRWTEICYHYFPSANYFLIEAQTPHEKKLKILQKKIKNMQYIIAAASDTPGMINFDNSELLGGIASHTPFMENNIVIKATTIDTEVEIRDYSPPYLIKLDTHGFEVPILNGAKKTLANASLVIIESYFFNFSQQNLQFTEMVSLMSTLGFKPVDICDPIHRPSDGALWQFDIIFEPETSKVFEHSIYKW